MKPLNVTALVICLIFGSAFGEVADDSRESVVAETLRLMVGAEEIIIEDLSPEVTVKREVTKNGVATWVEDPSPIRRVSLKEKDEIRGFVANFQPSVDMLREGQELPPDASGGVTTIYPVCQCLGDYAFRIIKKEEEVFRFTIHHDGEFMRFGSRERFEEYDLKPPSGRRITEIAKEALIRANSERRVGSLPSSSDPSASETRSSLGPRG